MRGAKHDRTRDTLSSTILQNSTKVWEIISSRQEAKKKHRLHIRLANWLKNCPIAPIWSLLGTVLESKLTDLSNFFAVNPATKYVIEVTRTSSSVFLWLLVREHIPSILGPWNVTASGYRLLLCSISKTFRTSNKPAKVSSTRPGHSLGHGCTSIVLWSKFEISEYEIWYR